MSGIRNLKSEKERTLKKSPKKKRKSSGSASSSEEKGNCLVWVKGVSDWLFCGKVGFLWESWGIVGHQVRKDYRDSAEGVAGN